MKFGEDSQITVKCRQNLQFSSFFLWYRSYALQIVVVQSIVGGASCSALAMTHRITMSHRSTA